MQQSYTLAVLIYELHLTCLQLVKKKHPDILIEGCVPLKIPSTQPELIHIGTRDYKAVCTLKKMKGLSLPCSEENMVAWPLALLEFGSKRSQQIFTCFHAILFIVVPCTCDKNPTKYTNSFSNLTAMFPFICFQLALPNSCSEL